MTNKEQFSRNDIIRASDQRRCPVCTNLTLYLVLVTSCVGQVADPSVRNVTDPSVSITSPPPSEADATQALAVSPRQGEWVDVDLVGDDRSVTTWIVRPERLDSAPVVLVVHEIFGLTDWVRAVADRLAENGFVAVVPDLLSGLGPNGGGTSSVVSRDEVVRLIRSLEPADVIARLNAVFDYAVTLPATTGTIAALGFCWGGSTSFAYALAQPHLKAAVVYYGSSPMEAADYRLVQAPVLGLYGGDDERVNATVPIAERAMKRYGKHMETEIFSGAGHGFLRAQETRAGANREASVLAWRRTIEFLRRHIDG